MDRRGFFKVLLVTVSGAFVKLPDVEGWGTICDGCDSDGVIDLSNFYPRHEVAESPDKWWAGDDVRWYSHDNGTWQVFDAKATGRLFCWPCDTVGEIHELINGLEEWLKMWPQKRVRVGDWLMYSHVKWNDPWL